MEHYLEKFEEKLLYSSLTPGKKLYDYYSKFIEHSKTYGDKMCLLYMVGQFYEIYSYTDDDITYGNANKITSVLNMSLGKMNSSSELSFENPNMGGFPYFVLEKHLEVLINAGYTVVIYDQVRKNRSFVRKLNKIVSPCTYLQNEKNNNLICIYFEGMKDTFNCGVSIIDLATGRSYVIELPFNKILDELYRILHSYEPIEVKVVYKDINVSKIKKILAQYKVQIFYEETHDKISYQEEFLKIIFPKCSVISPIEYIGLGRMQLACQSYVSALKFAYEHETNIVKKIRIPEIINSDEHLVLENNAVTQLDIFSKKGHTNLYKIINKCNTSMGKRLLNQRLQNPITDIDELNRRYSLIDDFLSDEIIIEKQLNKIVDIERLHRKITIGILKPFELRRLHNSYKEIKNIIRTINKTKLKSLLPKHDTIRAFCKYIKEYESIIDLETYSIKPNINKDIDAYNKKLNSTTQSINNICKNLMSVLQNGNVRVASTEKSGKHLLISKRNWKRVVENKQSPILQKYFDNMSSSELKTKVMSSNIKIESKEISNYSNIIIEYEELLKKKTQEIYDKLLEDLDNKYSKDLIEITNFIAEVDVIHSSAKLAVKNNYCKPVINENKSSFINAKKLRNPIVEKLIDTIYVPNDINLCNGMLLYGINSVGKSCLLKGVCLNVIMAQMGLYVAAESFTFSPYHNIFTRLPGSDNIFVGQSSFICELMDLKSILKRANEKTLCILDEITCSTENISGISISASSICELADKNSTFIFATHYHELKNLEEIKEAKIDIYHLNTEMKDGEIIFNRKLQKGCSDELYGLLVAKNIIDCTAFQKRANKIKSKLLDAKEDILIKKASHYNCNIYMDSCTICGSTEKLECHHINMQCTANDKGFIEHFHKNNRGNLVILCWECHHKGVHSPDKKIVIHGWKISSKYGRYLDYSFNVNN